MSRNTTLQHATADTLEPNTLLFLGDCNTLGTQSIRGRAYPERVSGILGVAIKNCGHTMCTTREAIHYHRDFHRENCAAVVIQYGLVDSWKTIQHAPYVLYYPDNKVRRFWRSMAKKYKKYGKKLGLHKLFGQAHLVPLREYENNLRALIDASKNCPVLLLETPPNRELARNPHIQKYNQVLKKLSEECAGAYLVKCYDALIKDGMSDYLDTTHIGDHSHEFIASEIAQTIKAHRIKI